MTYHPFRHLGLKLLAVALATLLWLTVAGEHVVERSMRVPLEFRNKPADLEIVGDPPTTRRRPAARVVGAAGPPGARVKSWRCWIWRAPGPGRGCSICGPTKCGRRMASTSRR